MNPRTHIFGYSANGTPILAHQFGTTKTPHLLALGGVHGNEPEGVAAATGLIARLSRSFSYKMRVTVIPQFNVDGVLAGTRVNGHGVDLNRNLPSKDWNPSAFNPKYPPGPFANSEPENQALTLFLTAESWSAAPPTFILSLHSWHPILNTNDKEKNGVCKRFAEVIAAHTNYPIADTIGYPTPGCLGTYAAFDLGIPTLTYEIERGIQTSKIHSIHVPAILEAIKVLE